MKTLLLFCFSILLFSSQSQTILRGPYLQSVNHESIVVKWRTASLTNSRVWYGADSTNLVAFAEELPLTTEHEVKISGLLPSTKYYYKIGNTNVIYPSLAATHNFTTHPIPGTSVPTRVWAIGDFGRGNQGQIDCRTSFENYSGPRGTDVWLWLGDNAYDSGTDEQYQSKVFGHAGFKELFSYMPFYPSPGNHDYNSVWSESTLLGIPYQNIDLEDHEGPYFDIVTVPEQGECGGVASNLEVFYSFDYGDVHFLSLNSEVFDFTFSYDGINQMKDWITQDLQQNTRKFTIAYFHQPPYTKGSHDSDDGYELAMDAMREKVVPLLEQFDMDLVVCGHSHVFERSYLIKGHYGSSSDFNPATMILNGTNGNFAQGNAYIKDSTYTTPEGTVYVVCGNSGSSESSPSLDHPVMSFGAGGMGSFVIDIEKNRLDGKYLTSEGLIADEFTILKKDMVLLPLPNLNICIGSSITVDGQNYVTGGSTNLQYEWVGTGQFGPTASFSPTNTTTYTLKVTDVMTGQIETIQFTISIYGTEYPAIVELIDGIIGVTEAGLEYQWLVDGQIIPFANDQYYSPTTSGVYTCQVTYPNGCSYSSNEYNLLNAGLNDLHPDQVMVYPNPAENVINIIATKGLKLDHFSLIDFNGKLVVQSSLNANGQIDISSLASGLYFINVSTAKGIIRVKFVKN
ncbi:MAG: metallophosphoesterase [Bacteroidota bacterium]